MARDPHKTPPPLTDTGRQRAIDDVVAEAADKIAELSQTPAPSGGYRMRPGDSSEMYAIAEKVVERSRPGEWIECERHGPAFKLGQRIDRVDEHLNHVDERVRAMEFAHTEERGANREIARQAASRTAMQTLVISGALAIVSVLLSAGINRLWPERQPRQQAPMVQPQHP